MPLDHEVLLKLPEHLKEMIDLFREIREANSRVEKKILKIESGLSDLVQKMEKSTSEVNTRMDATDLRLDKTESILDRTEAIKAAEEESRQKAVDQLDSLQRDIDQASQNLLQMEHDA